MVARSAADFLAPFAPKGRFEQLEIEHLEVFNAEDRFWAQYQLDRDAQAFGAQWAAFVRASVFPTLASALEGGVADPRSAQFFDRLEAGVATRLAAAPEQMQIPLAHLVLIKRPKKHIASAGHAVTESVAVVQRRDPGEPAELLAEVGR